MDIQNRNGLYLYHFKTLQLPGVIHAVFSRHGGVSPEPWNSLNIGGTVGDDPDRVNENLGRILQTIGYQNEDLVQVKQIHSSNIIVAESPMDVRFDGDGILTDQPGLLLLMRFADCVPIMIVDPDRPAVGIAHAGWKGTINDVAGAAVRRMVEQYGSNPDGLIAGIGPSIGPEHYEVGPEVVNLGIGAFKGDMERVFFTEDDRVKFNLWEANKIMLSRAGVKSIEVAEICTAHHNDDWFSHRYEGGKTGRFGAVIGLR